MIVLILVTAGPANTLASRGHPPGLAADVDHPVAGTGAEAVLERFPNTAMLGQIVGEYDVDARLWDHNLRDQIRQFRRRLAEAGEPLAEVPGPLSS
jgi:hypothetical protein